MLLLFIFFLIFIRIANQDECRLDYYIDIIKIVRLYKKCDIYYHNFDDYKIDNNKINLSINNVFNINNKK